MKRIIALICTFCLLFSLVMPLQTSAATWSNWTLPGGATVDENDTLTLVSGDSSIKTATLNTLLQKKFTISYSMKVNSFGSSGGDIWTIEIFVNNRRAGFQLSSDGWMDYKWVRRKLPVELSTWNDFSIELDFGEMKQTLLVNGEVMATTEISETNIIANNKINICFLGAGANISMENFEVVSAAGGKETESLLELTKDYTEAFYQDWNQTGGWKIDEAEYVTHDPENGTIRLQTGLTEMHGYRSIERPLRSVANFDIEFRMKINELPYGTPEGSTSIEISSSGRHSELSIWPHYLTFRTDPNKIPAIDGITSAMPFNHNHEWHEWRGEFRDTFVTWYVDGKKLSTHQLYERPNVGWVVSFYQSNYRELSSDMTLDWVKYTPYFEEELVMVQPKGNSKFAESKDVEFLAQPASDVEKVDYYVNDVYVGSGYKKDNYSFVLKNAKAGSYKYYAMVENVKTVEDTFYVKKIFDAELSLNKEKVMIGEKVAASVAIDTFENANKATKVEYYVNGQLATTVTKAPFSANLTLNEVGTAAIYAKAYDEAGMKIATEPKYVDVEYKAGKKFDISREYMVDYTYKTGNGDVEITDGYFKLSLKNSGNKLTYETNEGTKTYEGVGAGAYKAVVTAGYAEVYYNNHYLCSFFMPRSDAAETTKNTGVSDVKIGSSGVKASIYTKNWDKKSTFVEKNIQSTQYYSVEFDKTDASPEEFIFNDGMFKNHISFREDGIYANRCLTKGAVPEWLKLAEKVEEGYYRLTVGFGVAQLYRDNEVVGYYRCEKMSGRPVLERTMSNPNASTFIAIKNTDDAYYHTDTFEDITEWSYDNYWFIQPEYRANYKTDDAVVTKKTDSKGNHYLNLSGTGTYLLNGLDKNPVFKWRGMIDKREGEFFVVLRRSFGERQSQIVYDFKEGKWYLETADQKGNISVPDSKKDSIALQAGRWYNFELVCNDLEIKLLCDGKEVFATEMEYNSRAICNGRFGFGTKGASFNFDDVEYIGRGKVGAGFMYHHTTSWAGENFGSQNFYKDEKGVIHITGQAGNAVTYDNGRTWQVSSETIYETNIVEMPNGRWVKTRDFGDTKIQSWVSDDYGKNWDGPYNVTPDNFFPYGYTTMDGRLTCTMDGRVFLVACKGTEEWGHEIVFYSDDGKNWTKSETEMTTTNCGLIMSESTVVDMPNGEVWMFARSDSGYLDYFVSKDNGKTFDLTVHHTGLMAPNCMFQVRRDWTNPDTYYAVFMYNAETQSEHYVAAPRTRPTMAVSYDGCKTWEYVNGIMEGDETVTLQSSDMVLRQFDNQLYFRTTNMESGGTIFGVQDIDKIKTAKRMPGVHWLQDNAFDVSKAVARDHCVLPKTDGEGWIYTYNYDVKVKDGKVDVDTMSKVVGATAKNTSSGVEFRLGNCRVEFTNNLTSYKVNGETQTAEKAVLVNGYLDIKTLCEIFGRGFRETENTYVILGDAESVDMYQPQIDNLA